MIIPESFTKANSALRKLEMAEIATDDALDTSDTEAIRFRKRPQRIIDFDEDHYEDNRKLCVVCL